MITNYKINQPFTSNFSAEFQSHLKSWSRKSCQPCWNLFLRRSQKSQGKENHTVATLWKPIRSKLERCFSGSLQRKPFSIIRDKVFKLANEALNSFLKDLARQGLISFTKHKRPISSEDLEVLYAANQLGLNPPECFANSVWFNPILYFGKRGRENQREMKPSDLQLKTTTSRLKYFISSDRATKNQSTLKCSRFYKFCVSRL